jgi:phosphatidylglycerol:prolipoprotein diacylglycerol transferase
MADRWLDGGLVALVVGVLGARLGYVASNWAFFQERRGQILKFWYGGLEWRGALLGAALGLLVYCRLRKMSFWEMADELALVAPLVGVAGWLGCLLSGCAYGEELDRPHWLAADLPDLYGVWALRYNVQLLAAGWSLLTGVLLWRARRRLPAGGTTGLFLLLYGVGLGFIDPLRGDPAPIWRGWRLDVVADWALAAVGGLLVGIRYLRRKRVR